MELTNPNPFIAANLGTLRQLWAFIARRPLFYLLALAAALRFIALGSAPLWYDEAGAVWMASLPVARLIAATAADVHPPLFFLILKVLFAFDGPNTFFMRLPSALLGIAALPLLKAIADHLGLNSKATWLALVLMAVSPFELWYSQEARMYALLQFCILAMTLAGLKRSWAWFILAATCGLYTQNFAVFYYGLLCIALLVRDLLKPLYSVAWYQLFVVLMAPALLFSPWVFVIIGQLHNYAADWIPQVTFGGFLQPLIEMWWPQAMTNAFYFAVVLGAMMLWSLAAVQLIVSNNRATYFLAWMAFVPMLVAAGFSLLWKPIYISRPFIASAPFGYLLIALALTSVTRRLWIALAALPVLALVLVAYYPMDYQSKVSDVPATSVVNIIEAHWQKGDIIYHGNVGTMLPMWPETWNSTMPQYLMPVVGWSAGMLRPGTREALGMQEIPLQEIQWDRAWLVWSAGPTIDPAEDAAIDALLAKYPHTDMMSVDKGYAVFHLWVLYNQDMSLAVGN